jgi:hypothetical protein
MVQIWSQNARISEPTKLSNSAEWEGMHRETLNHALDPLNTKPLDREAINLALESLQPTPSDFEGDAVGAVCEGTSRPKPTTLHTTPIRGCKLSTPTARPLRGLSEKRLPAPPKTFPLCPAAPSSLSPGDFGFIYASYGFRGTVLGVWGGFRGMPSGLSGKGPPTLKTHLHHKP